ncbi:hypothetical protein ABZW03_08535 [Kitasatospora sp. NPDC004799]|uniref:hypothetical protein n=1 Tax=Kitasatospora sp. NPDC004799 TaxID=3154460 RepID=UPI0033BD861E
MDRRSEIAKHINNARAEVEAENAANARKQESKHPQPAADLSTLRQHIGAQFSIPETLRNRLTGTNAEEITADARKLAEHFRSPLEKAPTPLVKGGGAAEQITGNGEIDPAKLAALILQRRFAS